MAKMTPRTATTTISSMRLNPRALSRKTPPLVPSRPDAPRHGNLSAFLRLSSRHRPPSGPGSIDVQRYKPKAPRWVIAWNNVDRPDCRQAFLDDAFATG